MDAELPKGVVRPRRRVRIPRSPAMLALAVGAGLLAAGILSRMRIAREPALQNAGVPPAALSVGPLALAGPLGSDARAGRAGSVSFYSATLGREMPYLVYLPPGYDQGEDLRYSVLYMLHGLGGNRTEWTEYGIFEAAERLILAGQIPPMLIVLPEGEQSYWVDHADGGPDWGRYLARDVVGEIDARYRTLADRQHRAVGGNSMGAVGALQLAISYPDVFGAAGAHSPTLRGRDTLPAYFGDDAYFAAHDPVTLIQREPDVARTLRLWLDAGAGDYFLGVVTAFHDRLAALGIPHEFHVWAGPHDDEYWRANVAGYLRFYGAALDSR